MRRTDPPVVEEWSDGFAGWIFRSDTSTVFSSCGSCCSACDAPRCVESSPELIERMNDVMACGEGEVWFCGVCWSSSSFDFECASMDKLRRVYIDGIRVKLVAINNELSRLLHGTSHPQPPAVPPDPDAESVVESGPSSVVAESVGGSRGSSDVRALAKTPSIKKANHRMVDFEPFWRLDVVIGSHERWSLKKIRYN